MSNLTYLARCELRLTFKLIWTVDIVLSRWIFCLVGQKSLFVLHSIFYSSIIGPLFSEPWGYSSTPSFYLVGVVFFDSPLRLTLVGVYGCPNSLVRSTMGLGSLILSSSPPSPAFIYNRSCCWFQLDFINVALTKCLTLTPPSCGGGSFLFRFRKTRKSLFQIVGWWLCEFSLISGLLRSVDFKGLGLPPLRQWFFCWNMSIF